MTHRDLRMRRQLGRGQPRDAGGAGPPRNPGPAALAGEQNPRHCHADAERGDVAGQSGSRRCTARRSVMRPWEVIPIGCHAFSREFRIVRLSQIRSAPPHSLAGLSSRRVTEQYRSSPRHWNRVPSTTPPAERCQWPKIQRSGRWSSSIAFSACMVRDMGW